MLASFSLPTPSSHSHNHVPIMATSLQARGELLRQSPQHRGVAQQGQVQVPVQAHQRRQGQASACQRRPSGCCPHPLVVAS